MRVPGLTWDAAHVVLTGPLVALPDELAREALIRAEVAGRHTASVPAGALTVISLRAGRVFTVAVD